MPIKEHMIARITLKDTEVAALHASLSQQLALHLSTVFSAMSHAASRMSDEQDAVLAQELATVSTSPNLVQTLRHLSKPEPQENKYFASSPCRVLLLHCFSVPAHT